MAEDRVNSGDLDAEMPEISGALAPVPAAAYNQTLAEQLVPIVDDIRATADELGLMPYRVWLVHVRWTGTEIGDGQPELIARRGITPNPRIRDMNATSFAMRNTGLAEEGSLVVDRISTRFCEDDLTGYTPDLLSPTVPRTSQPNVEFLWWIQETRPSTPPPQPRLYVPESAPMLVKGGMEWRVALKKRDYNPGRYDSLQVGPFPAPDV